MLPQQSAFKIFIFADKIPKPAEIFTFGQYATTFIFDDRMINSDKIQQNEIKQFLDKANRLLRPIWDYGNFLSKISRIPTLVLLIGIFFILMAYEEIILLIIGILLMFFSAIGFIICLQKITQFEKYILDGEARFELAKLCKSFNEFTYPRGIKFRPGSICA